MHARLLAAFASIRLRSKVPHPKGTRLNVGVVASNANRVPGYLRRLDPHRFRVSIFTLEPARDASQAANPALSAIFSVLQASDLRPRHLEGVLAEKIAILDGAELDVAVFVEPTWGADDAVAEIALSRVAPLQVVASGPVVATSGIPALDLLVAGELSGVREIAGEFTERLGVVPGPGCVFEDLAEEALPPRNRESLGLPADVPVFVSACNLVQITPAVRGAWLRALELVPEARLVIHLLDAQTVEPPTLQSLSEAFDRALERLGLPADRVFLLTDPVSTHAELRASLAIGDVYLDCFPFGDVELLRNPLSNGTPVAALIGSTPRSRVSGGLLRSLGLDDLVATDPIRWDALLLSISAATTRRDISGRISTAMAGLPLCFDVMAMAEAFGDVIEHAFARLHSEGAKNFRAGKAPITGAKSTATVDELMAQATTGFATGDMLTAVKRSRDVLRAVPNHMAARQVMGRALCRQGQHKRAVEHLLPAAQQRGTDAELWFDLAVALDGAKQKPQALQALELSLRIDPSRKEGWRMFAESAIELGARDIAAEALQALRGLDPSDPATVELAARLNN